jgi:hypothetical protein
MSPVITGFQKKLNDLETVIRIDQELIPQVETLILDANMKWSYHKGKEEVDLAAQYRALYHAANRLVVSRGKHSGGSHALTRMNNMYRSSVGSDPMLHVEEIKKCISAIPLEGMPIERRIGDFRDKIASFDANVARTAQTTSKDQPGPSARPS